MQNGIADFSATSPEARANLFCDNLQKVLAVGKRKDKWMSLACFIEKSFLAQTENNLLHRSTIGQFRSISYNPETAKVYIHLSRKDFPNHTQLGQLFRVAEIGDNPSINWVEYHPALLYDIYSPRLVMCSTQIPNEGGYNPEFAGDCNFDKL